MLSFTYLVACFLLGTSLSTAASPLDNADQKVQIRAIEQRQACEPCGNYCCPPQAYCYQGLVWDGQSFPYCTTINVASGTRSKTTTQKTGAAPTVSDISGVRTATATATVETSVAAESEGGPSATVPGAAPRATATGTTVGTPNTAASLHGGQLAKMLGCALVVIFACM